LHTAVCAQVPQFETVFRFVSQPSLLPPQSPKPAAQASTHVPLGQDGVPWTVEHTTRLAHVVPHAEATSRFVSQPFETVASQLPKPNVQLAMPHAPAAQDGLALANAHATSGPQAPAAEHVSTAVPAHCFVVGLQVTHLELTQATDAQSVSRVQPPPIAQSLGQEPPQSTLVSSPFFTLSEHVSATHLLAEQ
jgi:hypothetical protein